MITLESSTQSLEELKGALIANGITPVEVPPADAKAAATPAKPTEPVVGEKPEESAAPAKPEETPVVPDAKTTAVPEPVETKPPESQVAKPPEKQKSKGGFQSAIDRKTKEVAEANRKVERLTQDLADERGDKTSLKEKLEAAQAELAKLKPPEPEVPQKLVAPVRPKRNDPAFQTDGFFDEDKYDKALDDHDTSLTKYTEAVAEQTRKETIADIDRQRTEQESQRKMEEAEQAFYARRDKDRGLYDDFDEVAAKFSEMDVAGLADVSKTARDFIILKSKAPGHLVYALLSDMVNDDGKLNKRLAALDDYDLVIELKEMEDRLVKEKGKAPKEKKPDPPETEVPPAAAEAQPEKTPEPEPRKQTVNTPAPPAPMKTVGGRPAGSGDSLEQLAARGDGSSFTKEFQRRQLERRKQLAGRV